LLEFSLSRQCSLLAQMKDQHNLKLKRVLQKLPFSSLAWDQLAGSCSNLKSFGNAPFLKKRGEGTAFAFRDSGSADGNHPDQKRGIPKKGIPASISGVDL
ncbi:hypothetical protein NW840_00160, partial [Synechococcus sp. R5-13]|uniref:hypothetical protein n=1 Tax=Synechococcus sp. R5-13 TaxID=2291953 RepID=UPI0039C0A9D8